MKILIDVMNQIILDKVRNAKYFPLRFDDIASDISQIKQTMIKFVYFQIYIFPHKTVFVF